jgi:hypothetical protein
MTDRLVVIPEAICLGLLGVIEDMGPDAPFALKELYGILQPRSRPGGYSPLEAAVAELSRLHGPYQSQLQRVRDLMAQENANLQG